MSQRTKRNSDYILLLCRSNEPTRRKLIAAGTQDQILAVCECCASLIQGQLKTDTDHLNNLRKHKSKLRTLVKKTTSIKKKKDILQKGKGALASILLPLLSSAIGPILMRNGRGGS